jgi:hypothetical protein
MSKCRILKQRIYAKAQNSLTAQNFNAQNSLKGYISMQLLTETRVQSCMNKIVEEKGDSKYKIPHMNKERLERLNQLPISIAVTQEAHNYDLDILLD